MPRPQAGTVPYAVLCDPEDRPALWAAHRLAQHLPGLRVVPSDLLALSGDLAIVIGTDRDEARFTLPDGAVFGPMGCRAVLNRMAHPPRIAATAADAAYATEEMAACALAFLAGFGARALNRPDPQSLAGVASDPARWVQLAHLAGLPAMPLRLDDAGMPVPSPTMAAITVIGDRAFGPFPALHDRACDLARMLDLTLMGIGLDAGGRVTGGTPLPDLSLAGDRGIHALARLMEDAA